MLNQELLSKLKQKNVSQNNEQTKERLHEIWLSAEKSQRDEILSLAGLTKWAVRNAYQSGGISVKLTLATAQVLKINPYFLTGESEWREDYNENVVRQFLIDKDYTHLAEYMNDTPADIQANEPTDISAKKKRPYKKREKPVGSTVDSASNSASVSSYKKTDATNTAKPLDGSSANKVVVESSSSTHYTLIDEITAKVKTLNENDYTKLESMPLETAIQFLTALFLRTEYSGESKKLATLIKLMLTL